MVYYKADSADVVGNVKLGNECSVFYNAVIRGDEGVIEVGEGTNVQDCAVLHTSPGHNLIIGNYVTIGHGAIVHGCTVGDCSLIGMGSIVMNGAVVGKNCIIGAGCVVTENTVIPDNSVVMGLPGKIKRTLSGEELESNYKHALLYIEKAKKAFVPVEGE